MLLVTAFMISETNPLATCNTGRPLVSLGSGRFEKHGEKLAHLKLRQRMCIVERDLAKSFQLEYLQGVDSTGYSYHHGNTKGLHEKCQIFDFWEFIIFAKRHPKYL